ncbi:Fibrinogen-like protein 1, partial [Bulinus truncatus]
RVNDLERWMYSVRNKLRSSRSSHDEALAGEESFLNSPQHQGISSDMGTMLKNSVGDLKAEWILLKRDVEAVKKESLRSVECQRELRNDTSYLRLMLNRTRDETREVETKVFNIIDQQFRLEKKLEKILTESENIKSQLEQQKMDYRHQEWSKIVQSIVKSSYDLALGHTLLQQLHLVKEMEAVTLKVNKLNTGDDVMIKENHHQNHRHQSTSQKSIHEDIPERPRDCHDIYTAGYRVSAVYEIWPEKSRSMVSVYCQMINNTGYTVIQRRIDGTINFNRRWSEYKHGFGNPYGEMWVGNDLIHHLTQQRSYTLRLDMWTWEGRTYYAEYNRFFVESEQDNYKLLVGEYSGDAGDSLVYHDKMAFSTEDVDNDLHERHCAAENKGGWWYNSCFYSQLNGIYHTAWYSQGQSHYADGIAWYTLKDSEFYSLKKVEMKLKPK